MTKKDEAKKMTEKTRKPGNTARVQTTGAKPSPTTHKGQAAQKKPVHAEAGTTFRLEAPQAAQVFVAGCFNEWNPTANPLERDREGTWSCALAVDPGEHE